jgi:uncharacterized membrane protein YqgA involved in biofilm formation
MEKMLGPVVNALTIAVCSLVGCFVLRGIPARVSETITKAAGLAVVYIGVKGAFESNHTLLLIMSLVIGAAAGELIGIDALMNRFGQWAETKLSAGKQSDGIPAASEKPRGNFAEGFVTASIVFCTGSMAIVGSMQSGLQGNHTMLFAKSVLDGSMSIVFAASLGIGVLFSAIPVLVYQGGIALAAMAAGAMLTPEIITEMSAVGSIVIAGIGFNFLDIKPIRVANLIPAVFIPWICL